MDTTNTLTADTQIEPQEETATSPEANGGTELAPVAITDRITFMDLLRGFALIGILFMNIEWFNRPISDLLQFDFSQTGADYASSWLVMVFVQGKFYKLFALLFGMGFAVMLLRAEQKGRPFVAWFTRRMVVLYVIGLAHMAYFWGGDILHDYAVGGMMLLGIVLLMRTKWLKKRNRPAAFAKIGFFLIIFPMIISLLGGVFYGATHDQLEMKEGWQKQQQISVISDQLKEQAKQDGTFTINQMQYDALESIAFGGKDETQEAEQESGAAGDEVEQATTQTMQSTTEQSVESEDTETVQTDGNQAEVLSEADEIQQKAESSLARAKRREFDINKERAAFTQDDYWVATQYRWDYAVGNLPNSLFFGFGVVLPLFLIGYWLVASGRIKDIEANQTFFRVMCWGGLGFGLFLSVGMALINAHPATDDAIEIKVVANSVFYLAQMVLTAGYLGMFALLSLKPWFGKIFGWLSPLGKMALTNYIMHSVILSTLFYGYGYAEFGQIGRAEQMGLVVIIIAAQAVFSAIWLKLFNYGPLEWLWRSATYLKLQPLKRA